VSIAIGLDFEPSRFQPYISLMKHDARKPPQVREIVYAEPFALARRLKGQTALTLLESTRRHEFLGRYSYLAVNPAMSIVNATLEQVEAHLNANARSHVDGLPPYQGGLAGFVSYDFGRTLEPKARIAAHAEIAPGMILQAYDTVISFDHLQERAWIVADHELSIDALEVLLKGKPAATGSHLVSDFASNMTRPQYEAAVQKTIDYILDGDIFQANITQCWSATKPANFDPYGFYKVLRQRNPGTFQALLDYADATVISSSPERLISFDGTTIEARPIKGTRRHDHDASRDAALIAELLASRKDRAENVMIVDLLRNDLSRVSKPGTVRVPVLCGLETYANVHHLVSVVTGELRHDMSQVDVFRAVFPGGSITGAPKIRAMEIIDELEGMGRGIYCGAIGYFGYSGHCDFNIAIRTVQIAQDVIRVQGGGGITARSHPPSEYDESVLKVKRIMEAFQP
jgi:para-aminobenzoate synthetase component I